MRREDNLLAVRRRKFVITTDSDHDFLVYPNLAQHMVLTDVNQLWVADITYLRLASEFVYFAVVLDAFSRRALGWSVGPSLHAALPLAALNRAIALRPPTLGLVHHSDRGTQYASNDYVRRLEECQITINMSRPARPWENARCERFMRTLKAEEIDCREYGTLAELERNLDDFIERFYNPGSAACCFGLLFTRGIRAEAGMLDRVCSSVRGDGGFEFSEGEDRAGPLPGSLIGMSLRQDISGGLLSSSARFGFSCVDHSATEDSRCQRKRGELRTVPSSRVSKLDTSQAAVTVTSVTSTLEREFSANSRKSQPDVRTGCQNDRTSPFRLQKLIREAEEMECIRRD